MNKTKHLVNHSKQEESRENLEYNLDNGCPMWMISHTVTSIKGIPESHQDTREVIQSEDRYTFLGKIDIPEIITNRAHRIMSNQDNPRPTLWRSMHFQKRQAILRSEKMLKWLTILVSETSVNNVARNN